MNILARILSHGFAIAVVLLLAVSFIHRGELFPGIPMPAFLGIEEQDAATTEAATEPDTTEAGTEPETSAATDVTADPDAGAAEPVVVEAAVTEPAAEAGAETGAELAPAGDTGPDADTPADAGMPAPVLPDEPEPQAETEIPAPYAEETDVTGTATEPDTGSTVSGAPQVVDEGTAGDEMATEPADSMPATEAVAVPDTAGVDDTATDEAAADTAAITEAIAPVEETPAIEPAPEAAAVTHAPELEAESSPPASDIVAADVATPVAEAPAAETAAVPPSPVPDAEPAPPAPVADAVEEPAVPGDVAQPAEMAAPDAPAMDATPAAEDTADETMLDMSRSYHVLAAAREAYWMRNHEEAESLYRRLIALDPENPDGYGELGNLYFTQGRWDDAASAYFEAGSRLVRTGHIQEARNLLEVIRGLEGSQADELANMIAESR